MRLYFPLVYRIVAGYFTLLPSGSLEVFCYDLASDRIFQIVANHFVHLFVLFFI